MRIAGTLSCSFVNGEGARFVVFVQGCNHFCDGCQNPDTWDPNGGYKINVNDLANEIKQVMKKHPLDGVTISGGEPYLQKMEISKLMGLLPGVDFWIYTGFYWPDIGGIPMTYGASHVVCGPFDKELKCEGKMYGSSNQYIIETSTGRIVG